MVSSRRDAVKPRKKERYPVALTPLWGAGDMGLRSLKGRQWLYSDFRSRSLIRLSYGLKFNVASSFYSFSLLCQHAQDKIPRSSRIPKRPSSTRADSPDCIDCNEYVNKLG